MANEIQVSYQTGRTVYFLVRNATSGMIWDTVSGAFRNYATADFTQFDVSMSEQGSASAYFLGNFPNVEAGMYHVVAKNQAGANPAETDGTIGSAEIHWTGSGGVVLPQSNLVTSGQFGQVAPLRLARSIAISGFPFKLVSAADHITAFTSGVVSGQISRNGGSFGALQSGTAVAGYTEIGNGWYRCNLTSGDLAADTVALMFTAVGVSGGSADQRDFAMLLQKVSGSAP